MAKNTVHSKLLEVCKDLGSMKKDGYNEGQKYSYFSDDQIAITFKTLFNKHGILFEYSGTITGNREISATKSGTRQFVTDVEVQYKFTDIETGDCVEGKSCGSGNDTGDKGVYKAITGAVKYIFMKTFHIGTGDDPEKDNVKEWKTKKVETVDEIFPDKQEFTEQVFEKFLKFKDDFMNSVQALESIEKKYKISADMKAKVVALYDF